MRRRDRAGDPALAPVAERLRELPHPIRTRIVLELAGDLDALAEDLRRGGLPAADAARRAVERVVPTEAELDALVRLHRPLYRRLTAPLSDTALRRTERLFLLGTTVVFLAAGVGLLAGSGLLAAPSPFLWPILALAGGVAATILAKGFRLLVRRDHRTEDLDRGLGTLLALAASALVVAGAGTVADLWALSSTMEAGVAEPAPLITTWVLREAVLLSTGLLTATCGGLGWFLLAQGVAAVRGGDELVRHTIDARRPPAGTRRPEEASAVGDPHAAGREEASAAGDSHAAARHDSNPPTLAPTEVGP